MTQARYAIINSRSLRFFITQGIFTWTNLLYIYYRSKRTCSFCHPEKRVCYVHRAQSTAHTAEKGLGALSGRSARVMHRCADVRIEQQRFSLKHHLQHSGTRQISEFIDQIDNTHVEATNSYERVKTGCLAL